MLVVWASLRSGARQVMSSSVGGGTVWRLLVSFAVVASGGSGPVA